jgi:pimeloyl-ACP methyl ester carboxylesterase
MNEEKKHLFTIMSCITVIVLLLLTINNGVSFASTYGQSMSANRTEMASTITHPLPVLLIHGYFEDSSVWQNWEQMLKKDHIPYLKANFGLFPGSAYDQCGSASSHANDLMNIIQDLKTMTGQNKVNIVAHSKGGLDARVFLNNSDTRDVANLIMIGTPNAGSPLAFSNDFCSPAVFDIRPGAPDLKAGENTNSKYFTIAGDWNPSLKSHCPPIPNFFGFDWPKFESDGFSKLQKPNDGIVPLSSVESLPYSVSLGHPHDCHTNLISDDEYELAKPILKGSIP